MTEIEPCHWVNNTGLTLMYFSRYATSHNTDIDPGEYYLHQVTTKGLHPHGISKLRLQIADRKIVNYQTFYLCNMVQWAEHYGLATPWPFVFTALLGIIMGPDKDYLEIDPNKLSRVLNQFGIFTPWQQGEGPLSTLASTTNILSTNYPLDSSNNAYPAIATSRELHYSSVVFGMATLSLQRNTEDIPI